MLLVHPDSTCDVCLDPYAFSNPAKTPHAIACGHVFCLECLAHLNHPTSCPLCRKSFGMDRVKKLHVDRHVPGEREAAMPDAWSLVQRLSRGARSEVSIQTTNELIDEGQRWLEAGNHKELFPEVDAVFSALVKFKSLQERFHDQQTSITSLTTRLRREEETRDDSRRGALVESGLTRKNEELQSELDFYKRHFPGVRDLANGRANSPTFEDRANGGRSINNQGNPLPLPPKPPKWYAFTARNPYFAQEPYLRTSIPPVPSQPYVQQTGAGAVYYEGASYEERVVPQMTSREPAQSGSGHRDDSAERRNRRRDAESDKTRRRRDRQSRRNTLEGAVELPLAENALGIHPSSLRPGQALYPTSDPNPSQAGGAPSYRPSTSHEIAPPMAGTASVPGSGYRDAQQNNGAGSFYSQQGDGYISRPSSTPIGPVHASWDSFGNASLNSLGLPDTGRDVGGTDSQRGRPVSASIPLTASGSVSSWGTAESMPANNDVFSALRPLASAPADSSFTHTDFFPRQDGQLLGVGRSAAPIVTPQPQLPPSYMPRDADNRSYSRHANNSRSQSQASHYSTSQPPAPPLFNPEDRGYPYASVPQPAFPIPHPSRSVTPATRPSNAMPLNQSFPQISAPPPINASSRPPNNTSQPYFSSSSQSQNYNYR